MPREQVGWARVGPISRAIALVAIAGACSDADSPGAASCGKACDGGAQGDAATLDASGSSGAGGSGIDAQAGAGSSGGDAQAGSDGAASDASVTDAAGNTSDGSSGDGGVDATAPPVGQRPPGCGDGSCSASESCDSCALDCAPCGTSTCGGGHCVTVDDTVQHQTIVGWEATSQSGANSAGFDQYAAELFDRAANELGLSRVRVEVKSPAVDADFDLAALDNQMTNVVLPLRAELAARGETLWINVCVVGNHLKDNPAKYAAETLRTVQHIETTYGFVPDSWEVALEPDVFGWDDAMLVGNALVAAGELLRDNGYDLDFVAPSTTQAQRAPQYAEVMRTIPNIFDHWRELSYHRYDYPDAATLQAIAAKADELGLRTSMLEHIDSGHADLIADLTEANVAAWQQYTIAYPAGSDNGAQYYWPQAGGTTLTLADRARYLRQFFAYVRAGSVRVDAGSTRANLKPVAFVTPDNRYVVVMYNPGSLTMDVAGLPAGTYGVTYTTASDSLASGPDVQVTTDSTATVSLPGNGVLTIFQR